MKKTLVTMLLLASMLLASCASDANVGDESDTTSASAVDETTTEAVDPNMPTFTDDYNGYDFRIYYPNHTNFYYQHSDEETGESVDDALYERDMKVEDELNINLTYSKIDGEPNAISLLYEKVSSSILAGDDNFDMFLNHLNWQLTSYIADKMVLDWYDIPNVDLSKPYWNQNMNDSLAISDVLPVAAGDFVIADPLLIFFNGDLAEANQLSGQYELVDSGEWTWDKLAEHSAAVTRDINGDGEMTNDDMYGFGVNVTDSSYKLRSLPASAGEYIYSKGKDGGIELTVNTPRMQQFVEKMVTLFNGNGGLLLKLETGATEVEEAAYFNNGNTLYYLVDSLNAGAYRSIDFEYGILPLPKFDEEQESYNSLNWSGLMLVPITTKDPAMVGCVSEWLSYYSSTIVQPEFFNTLMHEKVARDDRSADMLKLVFSTLVYDPAVNYKSVGFYTFFDHLVMSNNTGLASFYASRESAEMTYIETLNGYFEAFKEQ